MSQAHLKRSFQTFGAEGQSFKDYAAQEYQRCLDTLNEAIQAAGKCHQGKPQFYTILRHVARSGMSRTISVHYVDLEVGELRQLNYAVSVLLRLTPDHRNNGVIIKGCGMDMGFALIEGLSSIAAGESYAITQRWL